MASNILVHRYLARSRVVVDMLEDWQVDHKSAMFAADVEQLLRESKDLGDLFLYVWDVLWKTLFDGKVLDVELIGQKMQQAIEKTQYVLETVSQALGQAQSQGYEIEGAEGFRSLRIAVKQKISDFQSNWPRPDAEMVRESKLAIEQGCFQTTEELLRNAQNSGSISGF